MSIVGTRPPTLDEWNKYELHHRARLAIKPGIEKVLVIAPHPDDEINLAAQLIIELHKLKAEVYVLYTTNGDADFKIGNRRLGEFIISN